MKSIVFILCCLISVAALSQSPGQIIRPAGGIGMTVLNPNGDAFASTSTSGYTTNDISQSEIPFKVVPPAIVEPTGDLATGPSGGFTDIVKTVDGSGFYVYSTGTNILFRLRIGNIISGSKGYSVLIDTDGKIGNSGPGADPNYVAATNTSNGNPGFEYEVVLQTNFQVAVYNVDGTSNPGTPVATYALNTNSQIVTALSTDGNNPDYFYDWYVPLSAIGSPASFRMSATTVTSPSSALQGSRSDIYGIDDATAGAAKAWTTAIETQPAITLASIGSGGTGPGAACTAAPTLNTPITPGSNIVVSGTWTRLDVAKPFTATITLYKNAVAVVNTATVNSGGTWNITVPTIAPGDVLYAKAQAAGESQCLQSANVTAGCTSIPASPSITCASTKGITGNIPLGATVSIYQVTTANALPTTTPLTTGLFYTNNVTDQIFNYYGTNPQSGNACQGQNGILTSNATYMLVANNNGCLSAPTFICITGASQNSWNLISSNALALTTPIYPFNNTVSGTGATSGQLLRLFINNQYVTSVTATGSSFTFTGLTLNTGDVLKVYAQASGACMTISNGFTVSCYTQPPAITTNTSGNLLAGATAISGTSVWPGATINLYKGVSPSGASAGTTTANSSGAWTVSTSALTATDTYYATQTNAGCTSPSSAAVTVLGTTTTCPVFGSATYLESATSVGGTIPAFSGTIRLYLDGTQIGNTALSNATTWTILTDTNYNNTLYTGGVLTLTAQASGSAESTTCNASATVTCSPATQPVISPTAPVILTGQTVTFNVSNVAGSTWYAIMDNSGTSYATSIYTANANNFNLTTKAFSIAGTYNVRVSADKLSGCAASFRTASITVNAIPVPVRFITMGARKEAGQVKVSWTVANEQQVDYYQVERSTDCQAFVAAGTVSFRATTDAVNNYSYTDAAASGTAPVCYRVKQVDMDGRYTYSAIVSLKAVAGYVIEITPNPAKDQAFISLTSSKEQNGMVELVDMNGKMLYRKGYALHKDANKLTIDGLQAFPAGTYMVKVTTSDAVEYKKLIITK